MSGARIRSIKPEILEDAVTAGLSDTAFRVFMAMIVMADDYGNLRAEPGFLRGQIYWRAEPSKELESATAELSTLVSYYAVNGQRYASIRGWAKHQRVDKPGKPRVPRAPVAGVGAIPEDPGNPRESLATDQGYGYGSGKGTMDVERASVPPALPPPSDSVSQVRAIQRRGSRLPDDWKPKQETIDAYARDGIDAMRVVPEFRDYWCAVAGAKGLKLDWEATFRNRIRQLQNDGRAPRSDGAKPVQASRFAKPMIQKYTPPVGPKIDVTDPAYAPNFDFTGSDEP